MEKALQSVGLGVLGVIGSSGDYSPSFLLRANRMHRCPPAWLATLAWGACPLWKAPQGPQGGCQDSQAESGTLPLKLIDCHCDFICTDVPFMKARRKGKTRKSGIINCCVNLDSSFLLALRAFLQLSLLDRCAETLDDPSEVRICELIACLKVIPHPHSRKLKGTLLRAAAESTAHLSTLQPIASA